MTVWGVNRHATSLAPIVVALILALYTVNDISRLSTKLRSTYVLEVLRLALAHMVALGRIEPTSP